MQYSEHYEIHWQKTNGWFDDPEPKGVEFYERETVAWEELDAMVKDPDVKHAVLFRKSSVELGRHAKATKG